MSFDLILYKPIVGEDAETVSERINNDEGERSPIWDRATMKRTARALLAHDPGLMANGLDDDGSEEFSIEINGNEKEGIQICFFESECAISVNYWHEGAHAERIFRKVWNYVRIINRETGFWVYDPQEGEIYNPATDFARASATFLGTAGKMKGVLDELTENASPPKKPWWKFW